MFDPVEEFKLIEIAVQSVIFYIPALIICWKTGVSRYVALLCLIPYVGFFMYGYVMGMEHWPNYNQKDV